MAYLKTVIVKTNWLDKIDGLTVAQAIEYLQTLNPAHVLSYGMEGDTHGCSVDSELSYTVPMTNKEILTQLETHYLKEIAVYEKAKAQHVKDNRVSRIESCDINLKRLNELLANARIKYKE